MKLESNFGKIDEILKEGQLENTYAVMNYITTAIYSELKKIIKTCNVTENDKVIKDLESIILSVHKEDRGFFGLSFESVDHNSFLGYAKDKKCHILDEDIESTMRFLKTEILREGELPKYIPDKPIKTEIEETIEDAPFTEKDLENVLIKDLSIIEDGMTLIKNQFPVDGGYIDILARDKEHKLCIIELKKVKNDSKIIQQCVYYPTQFDEKVRMITIAPDYSNKISKSLRSLKYVEMKTYQLLDDSLIISDY